FFHPPLTQHNLFSHTKLASSEAFDYVTDFSIQAKLKVFFLSTQQINPEGLLPHQPHRLRRVSASCRAR
ncbi:hypothetical protein, partial [Variovorax ginsengisoli]|uniref:hypothetical protein n=1 Tax=Variovorax ginsengisoli TaxID=363844 RepID=UPI0027D88E9D